MNQPSDQVRKRRANLLRILGVVSFTFLASRPAISVAVDPSFAMDQSMFLPLAPANTSEAVGTSVDNQRRRETAITRAIAHAESAVVNIQGNKTISTTAGSGTIKQEVSGMGTGVIIDSRGYIITNLHVVQDVPRIEVTLADGTNAIAKLLNYDLETDLALIKIDHDKALPVVPFGTSYDLMRGETVIAIGNPFGYQNTVTLGVVSALHRDVPVNGTQQYKNLIQTNADINPGNSGGPLLNINGEVIGINVAVRVGAQGIGFAIPIDDAMNVMAELIAEERNESLEHGLTLKSIDDATGHRWKIDAVAFQQSGVQLTSTSSSNASHPFQVETGIQRGDILVSVEDYKAPPRLALELALLGRRAGDTVPVTLERNGVAVQSLLVLEEMIVSKKSPVSASETDLAWNEVGLRLEEVDAEDVQARSEDYQGGLRVLDVRPGSPAARQKISKGDVIVGVMSWQTPNWKALNWVLTHNDLKKNTNTRFYVVRNNRTFYVAMDLGQSSLR